MLKEGGFTLPEMMVTTLVMTVVLFALYNVFDASMRVFRFGNNNIEAVENVRLGLGKLEREVRAAYPYDKAAGKDYVLLAPNDPTLGATALSANQVTFGNDLDGNRKLQCPTPESNPRCEFLTYKLSASAPYTLRRVNTATPNTSAGDEVVGFVDGSGGLAFTYLKRDGSGNLVAISPATATPADIAAVRVVRAKLQINKDGRVQTLTTDMTLRNRGN